jgi:iron complex outermembrane receptor protein
MTNLTSRLVVSTALASGLILSVPTFSHAQVTARVEEVVVTATKTAVNVQNVPIAVTAVTAQALQQKGINDVAKLSQITPNVQLDAGTPFSGSDTVLAAYIRGIGQNDFAFNQDPGVGVYVDGVYLARSVGANTNMLDVDRVEILKGPQGTLFGRNTIGGAISIVTRDPGRQFKFNGEVTTGQFSRLDVKMTADLPINDKVLTSISFSEARRNGWQHVIAFTPVNVAPFTTTAGPFGSIPDCGPPGTVCPVVYDSATQFPAAGYETSQRPGGQNQWSTRGKVVFLPSDELKITLAGDYTSVDQPATAVSALSINPFAGGAQLGALYDLCLAGVPIGVLCSTPRLGTTDVPSPVPPLPALGGVNVDGNPNNNRLPYDNRFEIANPDFTYGNGASFSKLQNWGVSGTLDYDITPHTHLKSITAYRSLHWRTGLDADGSPLSIFQLSFDMPQHEFSQELQLTGNAIDERLNYAIGAYYFEESGHLHDFVIFPAGLLMIDGPNDLSTKAEAIYAHLNFKVNDLVSLTAGGRYTWEQKHFEGHQNDDNGITYKASGCYPPTASASLIGGPAGMTCQEILGFPSASEPYRFFPPGVQHLDFNNFSPTLGIEFHPSMDSMIYGSWSKGFKTGSWTTRLSVPHPVYFDLGPNKSSLQFDPEHATSEEIGIKTEWFDKRLRLNLAGFHTDYKGIQLNSQLGLSPTLVNAGNARIWGAEAEADAVLGHGLSFTAALGYTDAKYTLLQTSSGAPVLDNGFTLTLTSCPERLPSTGPVNRYNTPNPQNGACELPKTPKFKIHLGPQYVADMGDHGQLQFNVDWTYTSHLFNDIGNTSELKREATHMLDASITYRAPGAHWEASIGGTNLANERYIVTGQNQGAVAVIQATYSDPTEWFATFRYRY